jgi:hypothetical protein
MKVLLSIEEYRERIIRVVTEVVRETIIPEAPDYFKWKFIEMLTEDAVTNNFMSIDEVNQLFIKVFETDRSGRRLSVGSLKEIDQAEVEEFESQEWYVRYYEKCKKDYRPADRVTPFGQIVPGYEDNRLFDLVRAVQRPFIDDINTKYYIAKEIFKNLYGHDFEYNKEYKS